MRDLLLAAADEAGGDCRSAGRERVATDQEDGGPAWQSDVSVHSFITAVFVNERHSILHPSSFVSKLKDE